MSRHSGRAKRLAWAGLSAALVIGLSAVLIRAADGEAPAGREAASPTESSEESTEPSGLLPLSATAKAPSEQLLATITALTALATQDPDGVGPQGDQVLASLQQVQCSKGVRGARPRSWPTPPSARLPQPESSMPTSGSRFRRCSTTWPDPSG